MKVYKCDACGIVMEKPHEQKMKEFYTYLDYDYDVRVAIKSNGKQKIKIHLCDECFHALHEIAANKAKEDAKQ